MKYEIVTIKDIARELGISKSTVSRALHNSTDISEDTKKRVIEAVERLNYVPNPMALNLLKSRSTSIAVVVPDISNPFFSLVFSSMDIAAYNRNYHIMLYQSQDDLEREKSITKQIYNQRNDGIIASLSGNTKEAQHYEWLFRKGFPLLFFDRIPEELDVPSISVDDFQGGYQAAQHLIDQGCRRIAHIAGPSNLMISRKRMNGFKAAMLEHDCPIYPELMVEGRYYSESGIEHTKHLMTLANPPDGIFAASDRIAFGVHIQLRKMGFKMPHDVALIGFSDLPMSQFLDPPLSSIAQPFNEMGEAAVEMMIDLINNESLRGRPIRQVLKTSLSARQSSLRV